MRAQMYIFLNEQKTKQGRNAAWEREEGLEYVHGDKVKLAYVNLIPAENVECVLERAWMIGNGADPFSAAYYSTMGGNRSMSIGDVVQIWTEETGYIAFYCSAVGWVQTNPMRRR